MNLGQIAVRLSLGPFDPNAQLAPREILFITAGGAIAGLVTLAVLVPRLLAVDLRSLFRAPRFAELRFAAQAGLGLWILSILANLVNIALFGPNPQALVVQFSQHRGAEALTLDLLAGAVAAPIAEETLYRGILFAGLAQRLGFVAAASISALLFAAVHGFGVVLPIFVLGFGLAWIYQRTRTLWAPILAHAVVNTISLVILFISGGAVAT